MVLEASVSIVPLSDKPEFADTCAAWSFAQWGCQYGTGSLEKTIERYRRTAQQTLQTLPTTWIAMRLGKPAGMISLKEEDHPDLPDIRSWLASLFVHPEHRGQGISHLLIQRLEKEAKETFGIETLSLFTSGASDLYVTHGYEAVKQVRDPSGLHPHGDLLMKKDL